MLKTINIVATAALPWRTGTATLPLLRAYHLAQRGLDVVLYVPWIPPSEQPLLFGNGISFDSHNAQEDCMRSYLPEPDCSSLQIQFYPATYKARLGSILPKCALSKRIRDCEEKISLLIYESEVETLCHSGLDPESISLFGVFWIPEQVRYDKSLFTKH